MRVTVLALSVLLVSAAAAIAQDVTAPAIKISKPAEGAVIRSLGGGSTPVTGKVSDAESGLARVTVNGKAVEPDPDGSFFVDYKPRRGANTVTVTAVDKDGNSATKTRHFTYRPPGSGGGQNVLNDPKGDAHGSPIDLKRATRKKTSKSWIFTIEFWKAVPLGYLYYHGGASGNLSIVQGGKSWFVSGNCAGHCVESGPGKRGKLTRPNGTTVVFTIARSLLRDAPWSVYSSFGGTARCPRTGHTEADTPCKDSAR